VEEGEEEPPAAELEVAITSNPGVDYCRETTLVATVDGGDPPFDYAWTLGDGTVVNDSTSSRTIRVDHEFPSDTGTSYQVVLEVEDSQNIGGRAELGVSHQGNVENVAVRLRNRGEDNIHIYNRDRLAPSQYFTSSTRISRGSFRDENVSIPAERCGIAVEWGAGRMSDQKASAVCAVKKGEPGGSVVYDEQGFNVLPTLVCGE